MAEFVPDDLVTEILGRTAELATANAKMRESGRRKARAEADYQRKKNVRMAQMKAEGHSVTYIVNAIKGEPEVNEALFQREMAVTELQLRVMTNEAYREWGVNQPL